MNNSNISCKYSNKLKESKITLIISIDQYLGKR